MKVTDGPRRERRRILHNGVVHWSVPEGDELVLADGRRLPEAQAMYLPPCDPTKIICVHLNYESRRAEFGVAAPPFASYFQKPTTSLNSHRGVLYRPSGAKYLNFEGELAVVVGSPMRNVRAPDVWEHLAGFAPANDVGLHDFREADAGSMTRVKGQDGFCPIGPGLVRGVDPTAQTIRTLVNGKVVQEDAIANMIFPIDELVADLARYMTFLPGDIVLTGTPAHSRPLEPDDVVEVEITGVGRLRNTVAAGPAPESSAGAPLADSEAVRRVALGLFGAGR